MTPEDRFERIEQKIEFIVNQQAQFTVNMQRLSENQAITQKQIDAVERQQAQFAIDMQSLREGQAIVQQQIAVAERQIGITDGRMSALRGHVVSLAEGIKALVEMMNRVMDAQIRSDAKMAELAEKVGKLADGMQRLEEKGAETEERLNAFITFVERYLSRRDNGQQPTQE